MVKISKIDDIHKTFEGKGSQIFSNKLKPNRERTDIISYNPLGRKIYSSSYSQFIHFGDRIQNLGVIEHQKFTVTWIQYKKNNYLF